VKAHIQETQRHLGPRSLRILLGQVFWERERSERRLCNGWWVSLDLRTVLWRLQRAVQVAGARRGGL